MNQEKIAIITLIVTAIGGIIIPLLNSMFPQLFPSIGKFLISLNPYTWIIIVLVLIIIVQQIFIHKKLRGDTA
jgi:cytochrome bd-type quinol oxidase subunit 2